ncbi:hypothetical protein, partial [Enterobacter asburiae]
AIPMVDAFIAGASLIPSPTIASGARAWPRRPRPALNPPHQHPLKKTPPSTAKPAPPRRVFNLKKKTLSYKKITHHPTFDLKTIYLLSL